MYRGQPGGKEPVGKLQISWRDSIGMNGRKMINGRAVSYTHLDVYKRQS